MESTEPWSSLKHAQEAEIQKRGWYVVYTQPKREQVAATNLQQQGHEVYLPRYKTFKKSTEGIRTAFDPMFPRYVFFRPEHSAISITGARSTRGVSFLLSFGNVLAMLSAEKLQWVKQCEDLRNLVDLKVAGVFQPGLQARLRQPGLRGLTGLVTSVSAERVTLLLELLGRETEVEVEHHQLELA